MRFQRGFSLVELSVAVLIALFLIGGVLMVEQGVHRTYSDQSGLSQLQDEERFAMTVLRNVVESAGYFPDPTNNRALDVFPAQAPFASQLQTLYSPPSAAAAPIDSLYVRYATAATSNMELCDGTTAGAATYTSWFYVATDASGQSALYCQIGANAPVELVTGVTNMTVLYGINTTGLDNNVDSYLNPSQMTNADWLNVTSVVVTLSFTNPLYSGNANMQPPTVTFRQVIGVMSRT
jgi:type IV pilus assembly protein PilW